MKPDRPFAPRTMTTEQLITEIVGAEPHHLSPEVTRRCLDLFAEIVFERTSKGVSVELSHFGTFAPSAHGNVVLFSEN